MRNEWKRSGLFCVHVLWSFELCLSRNWLFSFIMLGVKQWIRTCLPRNPPDERSLLVWDSFRAHLTVSVKPFLQRCRVDVVVIPGGLTPVLQPLDKYLNKPFKDRICKHYLSWMITGPFEYTPAGTKRAPSRNMVLCWVRQAWRDIPEDMVQRSFKACRISNALDGTEDDAIYSKETPELADDEEMEDKFETHGEGEDEQ